MIDNPPISAEEMAEHVRVIVNGALPGVAVTAAGAHFEMTAPATGQRYRVTVEEIAVTAPESTEGEK